MDICLSIYQYIDTKEKDKTYLECKKYFICNKLLVVLQVYLVVYISVA